MSIPLNLKLNPYVAPGLIYIPIKKRATPELIMSIICNQYYQLDPNKLNSKTRRIEIVEPRQRCHFFAWALTKCSSAYIGLVIGEKDHATVLYSIKKIKEFSETENRYYKQMLEIYNLLSNHFYMKYTLEEMLNPEFKRKNGKHIS